VYEIVGITDQGVEKSRNEDRIVLGDAVLSGGSLRIERDAPVDVAVFDGVSSGGRADEATTIATTRYREAVERHAGDPAALVEAFGAINSEVVALKDESMPGDTVATTVGALSIGRDGSVTALYAGDTRVYRLRDGRLDQLSHDHTIIQRLKDENALELLAGIAASGAHVVTRAIGRDDRNPVETRESDPARPGDIYLLCSDGVVDGLLHAEPEHVQPTQAGDDGGPTGAFDGALERQAQRDAELGREADAPDQPAEPGDRQEGHAPGMTTSSQVVVTTSSPVQQSPASEIYDDERHLGARITRILLGPGTLMERAERIVARATRGGSTDNMSVLLVRACEPGEAPAGAPEAAGGEPRGEAAGPDAAPEPAGEAGAAPADGADTGALDR
jgi:serine/threonine protein phosphatase PrpC